MSKETKSHLIQSIRSTYRNDGFPELKPKEIEQYVESISFIEDIMKLSKTILAIIEYRTWSYVYWSPNCEEVLGYAAEDLIREGPALAMSSIHPDDLNTQTLIHRSMVNFFSEIPLERKNVGDFPPMKRIRFEPGS